MTEKTGSKRTAIWMRRETLLLAAVAIVGIVGLAVLQFSRQRSQTRIDRKALLQAAEEKSDQRADQQSSIQRVSGNLLNINQDSEAGKPYFFRMTNHAQGAVYELDPGDGSGRIPFDEEGRARHTYYKAGNYRVTLHARYEGEEAILQVINHGVGQPIQTEGPIQTETNKSIIDF